MKGIEKNIQIKETRKKELERMMTKEEFYHRPDVRELTAEYGEIQRSLESAYAEWEEISSKAEEAAE